MTGRLCGVNSLVIRPTIYHYLRGLLLFIPMSAITSSIPISSYASVDELLHFALTHGIIYGIKTCTELSLTPHRSYAVHAPFTLQPYEYPR